MQIAFIADCPGLASFYLKPLSEMYPCLWEKPPITVVPKQHGERSRGLKWKDFPYAGDIDYGQTALAMVKPRLGMPARDFVGPWPRSPEDFTITEVEVRERIRKADLVFCLKEWAPSAVMEVHMALEAVFPDRIPYERIVWPRLDYSRCTEAPPPPFDDTWERRMVEASVAEIVPMSDVARDWLGYSRNLNRFRGLFWRNFLAIPGQEFREYGLLSSFETLFKNVQILYRLRNTEGATPEEIGTWIREWQGTGRYSGTFPWLKLMDPRMTWWAWPVYMTEDRNTFAVRSPDGRIRLSGHGERLLDVLHPDCEDPDLPFRLDAWCHLPFEEARPKIDRYVRTWFGKQKRYQSRHLPELAIS